MGKALETIALIAYLSGDANRHKRVYLESLDSALRLRGFRLLLIDQAGKDIEGCCASRQFSRTEARAAMIQDRLRAQRRELTPLGQAVALEAGYFSVSEEQAEARLLPDAAAIMAIIETEEPAMVIIWHQFNGVAIMLDWFCREKAIPFLYAHLGPLPGTITFEPNGQMAESWVVRENKRFMKLPAGPEALSVADLYLEYVRQGRLDRKTQPIQGGVRDLLRERINKGPIVFYAGQNDYRTGMTPRSLPTARWHSPHYSNTEDALQHLAQLARKKDWTILFKPHPNMDAAIRDAPTAYGDSIIPLDNANLFECIEYSDVTVTILSGSSYQALIHKRPVVLLGHMNLTGKKCVYELRHRCLTGFTIARALQKGFTVQQQGYWRRHVAQVLCFYAFAFDKDIGAIIGRTETEAANYILSFIRQTG